MCRLCLHCIRCFHKLLLTQLVFHPHSTSSDPSDGSCNLMPCNIIRTLATGVIRNIFPPPRPRPNAHTVQQFSPLQISHSIHRNWSHSCLQFHTPNYLRLPAIQAKCLRVFGNCPRRTPISHLHDTLHTQPIHRITANLFLFCSLPLPPQPPGPTNRELHSSRPDHYVQETKLKLNSVALVRKRTIPTERPPPVGEVSANFCG